MTVPCDDCGVEIDLDRDSRWEYGHGTYCEFCGGGRDIEKGQFIDRQERPHVQTGGLLRNEVEVILDERTVILDRRTALELAESLERVAGLSEGLTRSHRGESP